MEINVYKHKHGVLKFVEVSSSYDVDIRENGNYDFFKQMNMESHEETQTKIKQSSNGEKFVAFVIHLHSEFPSIHSARLTRFVGKTVQVTIEIVGEPT